MPLCIDLCNGNKYDTVRAWHFRGRLQRSTNRQSSSSSSSSSFRFHEANTRTLAVQVRSGRNRKHVAKAHDLGTDSSINHTLRAQARGY